MREWSRLLLRILQAIEEGGSFIAVGVAHLIANEDGLIQSLETSPGVQITRMAFEGKERSCPSALIGVPSLPRED